MPIFFSSYFLLIKKFVFLLFVFDAIITNDPPLIGLEKQSKILKSWNYDVKAIDLNSSIYKDQQKYDPLVLKIYKRF